MSFRLFVLFCGIIGIYLLLFSLHKSNRVPVFFTLVLLASFTLWYTLPILLSNCDYWYFFESMVGIEIEEYNLFAIGEVYFYLLILLLFRFSLKWNLKSILTFEEASNVKVQENILIIYSLSLFLYNLFFRSNYLENNDIDTVENGVFFLLSFFSTYISSYFYVNIFCGSHNKKNSFFLFFIILSALYSSFIGGARIYLVIFIWLYIIKKWHYIQRRRYLSFFSPLIILLLCASLLLPFLSAKRSDSQLDSSDMKSMAELTLYHLNLKLNSIAYSTTLITRDGEGFAGYEPYVGSLFKYMPRAIWNAKPTPTSYNGTVAGTPSRRIPELLNLGNSEYANVGTSAFLVSLWQGWMFVIISIVINFLYLRIILIFLVHPSYWLKAIGFNLLFFPQLILTPSFGDNLIQKMLEILILLIFLYLFKIICIKINTNENCNFSRRIR